MYAHASINTHMPATCTVMHIHTLMHGVRTCARRLCGDLHEPLGVEGAAAHIDERSDPVFDRGCGASLARFISIVPVPVPVPVPSLVSAWVGAHAALVRMARSVPSGLGMAVPMLMPVLMLMPVPGIFTLFRLALLGQLLSGLDSVAQIILIVGLTHPAV